jgi:hypothetical protein
LPSIERAPGKEYDLFGGLYRAEHRPSEESGEGLKTNHLTTLSPKQSQKERKCIDYNGLKLLSILFSTSLDTIGAAAFITITTSILLTRNKNSLKIVTLFSEFISKMK